MWEVTAHAYKKRRELLIYDSVQADIKFSKNGAYMMLTSDQSKFATIYDAFTLAEVSKVTFNAKDAYGNDVSYYSMITLSYDGSYVLATDYSKWYVFSSKGELVSTLDFKSHYTIYPFSKTEYLVLQYPEYPKTSLIAVDFIKNTERVLHKADQNLYNLYLSDDSSYFIIYDYSKHYYGSFKSNDQIQQLGDVSYNIYRVAFKGSKIAILYSFNYEYFVVVYQDGKLLWKDNVKTK